MLPLCRTHKISQLQQRRDEVGATQRDLLEISLVSFETDLFDLQILALLVCNISSCLEALPERSREAEPT